MVKRGSITVFLALTLGLILSLLKPRTEVSKNGSGKNTNIKRYGCWTIFFVWTIQQVPFKGL